VSSRQEQRQWNDRKTANATHAVVRISQYSQGVDGRTPRLALTSLAASGVANSWHRCCTAAAERFWCGGHSR